MLAKREYETERLNLFSEMPKGLWKDVKIQAVNKVGLHLNTTQILIHVFLMYANKTLKDYEGGKND